MSKELKKQITETVTIKVYEQDPRRCHINCRYCYKNDGLYHCERYGYVRIDGVNPEIEDTEEMYGFERTKKCVEEFGL